MSDSLWPHESQHARPPCPSPTPGVHSDSCASSQWCHPAISSSVFPFLLLPRIPPSIRVFSNESTLRMRWPKYWSFSFSIISSKEIPGLISFRMDWLDLLAVKCGIAGSFQVLSQGCDQNASPGRRLTWGLQCRRNHFHAPSPARWLQASLNSLNVGLSLGQDVVAGFPQSKQEKASTQKSQPF